MKFSYTLAAVFATAAVAAPVAQAPAAVPVDAGLLAKLSPDVAALVTGLGLTTLAPGLAATLVTLSEGLKTRTDTPEIPVDAGLLAKLSPDVAALVTGLGLTSLAPGLASTLVTLSEGLKTRQIEGVVNTVETVVTPVADVAEGLVKPLGGVAARQLPAVPAVGDVPVVGGVLNKVTGLVGGVAGGVAARQLPAVPVLGDVPVVGGVLNEVTGVVGGVAGGVGARQLPAVPAVGDVPLVGGVLSEVTGVVGGVAGGVGARDAAGVPVDAGLLAKLSPDVAALVTGLGLTTLAPGLAATLITLSEGLKTRDVAAELKPAVEAILAQFTGTVEDKVVPTVQGTVEKVVPAVSGTVEKVTGALGGVGARQINAGNGNTGNTIDVDVLDTVTVDVRDVAGVPVDAGLLAKLSPDVAALVTGLGLTSIAPGLASTLVTLSEGLKTRTDSPVPDIPVDAGLLAKLSPDVAALVSGLGLTSIAPGLAATLVTLSEGLKTRQLEGVVNTAETVVTPVADVAEGLVKPLGGVAARQLPAVPVLGDVPVVGGVLNEVTGVVGGVAGGVGARQSSDPLAKLTQALYAILGEVTDLVSDVAAPVTAAVGKGAAPVGAIVGAVGARQSSDPLAKITEAVYGILNPVTSVVSDVAKPVVGTVGQTAAPVGAVVGAVGARDVSLTQVDEIVKTVTSNAGTIETVSKATGAVPVDAGLLAQLSAPIAGLVSGLGLVSISPALAATLITLSQGL